MELYLSSSFLVHGKSIPQTHLACLGQFTPNYLPCDGWHLHTTGHGSHVLRHDFDVHFLYADHFHGCILALLLRDLHRHRYELCQYYWILLYFCFDYYQSNLNGQPNPATRYLLVIWTFLSDSYHILLLCDQGDISFG